LGAAVLEHRRAALAHYLPGDLARIGRALDVVTALRVPHLRVRAIDVEAGRVARAHLLDPRGQRDAVLLHAVGRRGEAERVPDLERAEVPVVAPLHRVIDVLDGVGDLRDPAR